MDPRRLLTFRAVARGPLSLRQLAEDNWIFASTEGFLVQACRDVGFEPRIVAAPARRI